MLYNGTKTSNHNNLLPVPEPLKLVIFQFDTRYVIDPQQSAKDKNWANVHFTEQTAEINRLYSERWNYPMCRIQYGQDHHCQVTKLSLLKEVLH